MPAASYSNPEYKEYVINTFTGGMKTNPVRSSDHFIIYNMMIREDGYLCPRGTVFEKQLDAGQQPYSTYPIDIIVNNTGGPSGSTGEQPYMFFLGNFPNAGKLGFFSVQHSGVTQTISSVDNTLNATIPSPVLPAVAWGISATGAPIFIFSVWNGTGDDAQYQWSGSGLLSRIATSPPAAQTCVGFYDKSVFAGGGSLSGSITLRNTIYWSTPLSPTVFPVANYANPFSEKGLALLDFSLNNSAPLITTNVSFLSLTGDTTNGFIPVELGRVEDIILKGTLSTNGTIPFVAALNGVYTLEGKIKDISLPIKGVYNPTKYSYGMSSATNFKAGFASLSTNGYFYAVQNQAPQSNSLITKLPLTHTANENSIFMVYDTRFKAWYYWGYEFSTRGICPMDPNALNVSTSSNTFLTGFAFTGQSPAGKNSLYFSESSNTTGNDTVDGATVNYKTGFTSGPIDFGVPHGLKQISGIYIVGNTSNSVTVTIEGKIEGDRWEILGNIKGGFNQELNINVKTEKPIRLSISGDSTMIIKEVRIKYSSLVPQLQYV